MHSIQFKKELSALHAKLFLVAEEKNGFVPPTPDQDHRFSTAIAINFTPTPNRYDDEGERHKTAGEENWCPFSSTLLKF